MPNGVRARARAQFYGPEMLAVIRDVVARLEREIAGARRLDAEELAALLESIREPLATMRDRATTDDDPPLA